MSVLEHPRLGYGHSRSTSSLAIRGIELPVISRPAHRVRPPHPWTSRVLTSTVVSSCPDRKNGAEQTTVTAPKLDATDNQTDKEDDVSRLEPLVSIRTLPLESTYDMAIASLLREIESLTATGQSSTWSPFVRAPAATIRIEVPLPRGLTSLQWLRSQDDNRMAVYFSSKMSSAPDTEGSMVAEASFSSMASVAGLGHAWMWRGKHGYGLDARTMAEIAAMTDSKDSRSDIKVLGGSRFDTGGVVGEEWAAFGSFCFVIPRIEYVERGNGCVLACTLAWDAALVGGPSSGDSTQSIHATAREVYGFSTMQDAVRDALRCISELQGVAARNSAGVIVADGEDVMASMRHVPDAGDWDTLMDKVQRELSKNDIGEGEEVSFVDNYSVQPTTALDEYLRNGQKGLDDLLAASKTNSKGENLRRDSNAASTSTRASTPPDHLVKLVLARKTTLVLNNEVNCCDLLEAIQEKDPKAYQFMLRLADTGGGRASAEQRTFLGCTPERLYCRTERRVVSEAVAGTRGRGPGGDIEKDFWLAFDLLQSQKDGLEFQLVRESIVDTFEKLCDEVDLEVDKSILKQGSVQHLYGRIAGSLKSDVNDLDLVRELHPTPAVCGQPDQDAMCLLRSFESFDRGFYAGPFGWFSKNAADIAVAIRSSLVGGEGIDLYAGVGIVPGSSTSSEWNELDLKISQFTNLFRNSTKERIMSSQNVSILAAQLIVEELCRCGCNTFCIAPGSRSSPLTLAIAQHPRARIFPGIDERSLGFWALGHGKATGRPCAVITSSGTAVANLLPAVVEASQSNVPLLLLTADRPAELRDSGANQTIDQVRIFGKYVRWEADLLAPSPDIPLRSTLAAVSNGVRIATSRSNSGPVHLNCQFREPLHPVAIDWARNVSEAATCPTPVVLQGLDAWITDTLRQPLTLASSSGSSNGGISTSAIDQGTLRRIMTTERGLIVVGELADPDDVSAAKQIASYLGWPIVGDVLSGLRIGGGTDGRLDSVRLVNHMDHMLLADADGRCDVEDGNCHAHPWDLIKPDVILHLGSRLTSKRLFSFLEWATQHDNPATWILANRKTTRYDPANVLDVRLDCSVVELHRGLISSAMKRPNSDSYSSLLMRLDAVVGNAIAKALDDDRHLMSEAHVAKMISHCLPDGDGLFVGNSMPIRDLDMFGGRRDTSDALMASFVGAPIAANRGASGIDGVLSSAAGFADGLQRNSTLVIGDVSFIHDINGLNLLRTGAMSPALTVVLINNSGGGIFNFLPIATGVPDEQFRPLWTTPQYVDVAGMCRAQGIPHMRVTSLAELETSLKSSWALNRHCVLEVITNIESNVEHHNAVKEAVSRALDPYFSSSSKRSLDTCGSEASNKATITRVRVKTDSFPLKQQLTTVEGVSCMTRDVAYILMDVVHSDGLPRRVIGEVAPLPGLHQETLREAISQAEDLADQWLCDVSIPENILRNPDSLLKSLLESLETPVTLKSLYPSVACGLEAALFQLHRSMEGVGSNRPATATRVSALLNPYGKSADLIAEEAERLVCEGYNCIKVKAGREDDPAIDAQYFRVIRRAVGPDVVLRVDANQAWTEVQAATYVKAVAGLGLEYLEEPLANPEALFNWNHVDVPVALDESIDQGVFDPRDDSKPLPEAVKVVVIKPSLLGGLSETLAYSRAASSRGIRTIVSSSFESPVGLLHLSQIAEVICNDRAQGDEHADGDAAHGISTESWFENNFSGLTSCWRDSERVGRRMPSDPRLGYDVTTSLLTGEKALVPLASFSVLTRHVSWHITHEISDGMAWDARHSQPIVLLHGMFGSAAEMRDLAGGLRRRFPGTPVLCVDLPGHGQSLWTHHGLESIKKNPDMLRVMSEALDELLQDKRIGPCTVVGYSLGARLALSAHVRKIQQGENTNIRQVIALSGSPGVSETERAARATKDDATADSFESLSRQEFFDKWYSAPLWDSLRELPGFSRYVAAKAEQTQDAQGVLAATLRGCSPGRVESIRDALHRDGRKTNNYDNESHINIVMVVGSKDTKYVEMASSLDTTMNEYLTLVTVEGVGHAMHLEAAETVANLISKFVQRYYT